MAVGPRARAGDVDRAAVGSNRRSLPIEKAIRAADLGLNPSNDGKLVRIPIPPLTEERRKQLAKQVHEIAEDHRTAVRNIRRDSNERLKKMLKEKQISEDNERDGLEEVQKLTNTYIGKIDELAKSKETEHHQRLALLDLELNGPSFRRRAAPDF